MTPASHLFDRILRQIAQCKDLSEYHDAQRQKFGLNTREWVESSEAIKNAIDNLRVALDRLEDVKAQERNHAATETNRS